mgnify:CR=1 FL=1
MRFSADTEAEKGFVKEFCEERGCEFAIADVLGTRRRRGEELARKVLNTLETKESQFHPLYPDDLPLKDKIETVAREIYGADGVDHDKAALKQLAKIEELGLKMCRSAWQKPSTPSPMIRHFLDVRKDFASM